MTTMTKAQLVKYGMLAFGRRWKYAMAEKLDISREQLWRYETGATGIGDDAAKKIATGLLKHFEAQQTKIAATCKELKALI